MPRGKEPWGTRYVGKPAVREGLATRFAGLPTSTMVKTALGGRQPCVSTWLLTGTTRTGEQIRVRGVDLLEFRDGKVSGKTRTGRSSRSEQAGARQLAQR